MKIARFKKGSLISYGLVEGQEITRLDGTPFYASKITQDKYTLEGIKLLAPCEPSKIVAVGLNYLDHARELKMDPPDEPILFLKPPTSVIGPEEDIIYPPMSSQVDYEAELAVVVKKRAKNIEIKEAPDYIFGYTCANDVTARDLQRKDVQWTRAKSFDTFSPIGPWIETELNPSNLQIKLLLNGKELQSSSTSNMIFDVPSLVSFISQVMTLNPGDVIMTGTPPGVGPIQVGDTVEVSIDGIGYLRNFVSSPQTKRL